MTKNVITQMKKHSGTSPDLQLKIISLTKQKTRPEMDYDWIAKNSTKNAPKMPQVNKKKPLARKRIFVHTPLPHSTRKFLKNHSAKALIFYSTFC